VGRTAGELFSTPDSYRRRHGLRSDPLDTRFTEEYAIKLIMRNGRWPERPIAERLCAWVDNFRCAATRWEYHIKNFLGFVHLACLHLLSRHL